MNVAPLATLERTALNSCDYQLFPAVTQKIMKMNTPNGRHRKACLLQGIKVPSHATDSNFQPSLRGLLHHRHLPTPPSNKPPPMPTSHPRQRCNISKSIPKTWCSILTVPNDDDNDGACAPCADDNDTLVNTCACVPNSDLLCGPCVHEQEFPVLQAIQKGTAKPSMPPMPRPTQAQRMYAPLTAQKIANVERKARKGELHLPELKPGESWSMGAPVPLLLLQTKRDISLELRPDHLKPPKGMSRTRMQMVLLLSPLANLMLNSLRMLATTDRPVFKTLR